MIGAVSFITQRFRRLLVAIRGVRKSVVFQQYKPMEPLHVAHLILLGMWLGVVITEALFEFAASGADKLTRRDIAHTDPNQEGIDAIQTFRIEANCSQVCP